MGPAKGQSRNGRVIEMVHAPSDYRPWQLDRAVQIAVALAAVRRGTFVYCEPPACAR